MEFPIESYFTEGKRLWDQSREQVVSRAFYELWEKICMPKPFPVEREFTLCGKTFSLPETEAPLCAHTEWNRENQCASLIIESDEWSMTWLLHFGEDGTPLIEDSTIREFSNETVREQDIMELFCDAAAWFPRNRPSIDLLNIRKKDFLEFLPEFAREKDPALLKAIRKMGLPEIREYLGKAIADHPEDELDLQMTLPLGGLFAPASEQRKKEETSIPNSIISGRTLWEACLTMDFLLEISSADLQFARDFSFSFTGAKICGEKKKDGTVLQIPYDPENPVEEGDTFNIYSDSGEPCGFFTVEVIDRDVFYGCLNSPYADDLVKAPQNYTAKLQKNPRFYTSEEILRLKKEILQGKLEQVSAVNDLLGLRDVHFTIPQRKAPDSLSPSQKQAWLAAVEKENRIVLIQGPPGTGKTFVLEQVIREFARQGLNVLVSAPSNAAVDNICRKLFDLPVLRCGKKEMSIAPDVASRQWGGRLDLMMKFQTLRKKQGCSIIAGTHFGILRDDFVNSQFSSAGAFDAVLFDEAGMSSLEELLLCARLGKRAILFGDHRQLQPFPLRAQTIEALMNTLKAVTREESAILNSSAMEWLAGFRNFPVVMLKESFRCQNPRLLRFASLLFYNAEVKPASDAEYYHLPYHERQMMYPPETLAFYSTSALPFDVRKETLSFGGSKPGLSNEAEAIICAALFYKLLEKYLPKHISIIAPYRKQTLLIRQILSLKKALAIRPEITDKQWEHFLLEKISTVDSFQGSESDAVIVTYVRSNRYGIIGFTDNPNRINVAHTRCRKELFVTGDLEGLKQNGKNRIFTQMERAFQRDGVIFPVSEEELGFMREEIGFSPTDILISEVP